MAPSFIEQYNSSVQLYHAAGGGFRGAVVDKQRSVTGRVGDCREGIRRGVLTS